MSDMPPPTADPTASAALPKASDRPPSADAKRLTRYAVLGLVAWGCCLALGSFLGLDNKTPSYDWRRMLVMLGTTGLFLAVWLGAMSSRSRRLKKLATAQARPANSTQPD